MSHPPAPSAPHSPSSFRLPKPSAARALVVGGGTMGVDVAAVLARAGCPTLVVEPSEARRAALGNHLDQSMQALGYAHRRDRIRIGASLDDVAWPELDIVIECVPEKLDIKQALFADLERRAAPHTLLCSNSSSFPISAIGAGLATMERMFNLHFFMPAHLVPAVEVVLGAGSDPQRGEALCDFMRGCGMVPLFVRKDLPGFLANRLQHALAREAFAMIDEGIASPEDIDNAVRFGFGFRFLAAGPVLQRDHAGLDIHCAAAATMYPSLSTSPEPAKALSERVAAGKFGMKAGEGFFRWTPEAIAAERARYDRLLLAGLELLRAELPQIDNDQPANPPEQP